MRLFYSLAITAGLLAPTVSFADTYDALCSDNDCEITINEFGFSGPKGFIPKDKKDALNSPKLETSHTFTAKSRALSRIIRMEVKQ